MSHKISRRAVLARGMQIPLGGALLLSLGACGQREGATTAGGTATAGGNGGATACADPAEMSEGERSIRASLTYTDASTVPDQQCKGCAFFHAAEDGSCGKCDMFNGGLVNASGRCISWSPRT